MKIWMYDLGSWIKDGYEIKDRTNENFSSDELSDYIDSLGFLYGGFTLGGGCDERIKFHPNKSWDNSYLCETSDLFVNDFVFYIPNYPSLLEFRREYRFIYTKNYPDFIEVDNDDLINVKKIINIKKKYGRESASLYFNIEGSDHQYIKHFKYERDEVTKKIINSGPCSINWLIDNLRV